MTSTYCPRPALPAASAPVEEGYPVSLRRQRLVARLRRQAARLWGAGSVTPTSEALDAVDVPSFHR